MRKTFSNKFIALILSLILVLTTAIPAFGETDTNDVYLQYSGTTDASYGYKPNCTFTINRIVGGRFKGNFSATNLGAYNISQFVDGVVYENYDSFTCVFSLDNYYNTSFVITVYPFEGYCECLCEGSWHMEDFNTSGTTFTRSINTNDYDILTA